MIIGESKASQSLVNQSRWKTWLVGITIASVLFVLFGFLFLRSRQDSPGEAPEAEAVLNAQMEMPFQILIPAYLPKEFVRKKTQVNLDKVGPQGELMVQLVYTTGRGDTLDIFEWLPGERDVESVRYYCQCMCVSTSECNPAEMGVRVGTLRVMAKVSSPTMLSSEEARAILDTLGPAVNSQIYSSLKQVPVAYSVSPAVDVPISAAGKQELTLVVTPNGYSPEHFAVQKGVPVILTFRQTGQVGCGDELILQWGQGKTANLELSSLNDVQTLEFIPTEVGDFPFNCPHLIYRGVMTVKD